MLKNVGLRRSTTIGVALLLAALVAALVLWEGRPAEAAFPGVNGKITFTRDPEPDISGDVNNEIYVMDADGQHETRLTNNGQVFDNNPAFAPNGTKIAFDSGRDGNDNIYMMSATDTNLDGNGENQRRLTKNIHTDVEPAFSPSGTKIAFSSNRSTLGGNNDIYIMRASPEGRKNRPKNLTKDTPLALDVEPSFSPDGTKIVFASNRQGDKEIYVMDTNPATNDVTRLTNNAAFDSDASFSPDGDQIVFRSTRGTGSNSEVFVMDAVDSNKDGEGDNLTNISNDSAANDGFPAFSPDGTKIVFRSNRTTGTAVVNPDEMHEIFAVNSSDGSGLVQLTNNDDAENARPDWGPLP